MSVLGTLSAVIAAHLICLIPLAFGRISYVEALIITAVAFAGCIFDSLLGSLLQAKYRCHVCGRTVESKEHCGQASVRISGLPFVTNNAVNFLGTTFSAAVAILWFSLI